MSVELRQLRYFIAVAEERHFGHAAIRLRITQPGLSKQIKHLEESIGVCLLVRDKRHVELTRAGEVLLRQARLAVGAADRAIEDTRAAGDEKTAILKVGAYALGVFPALAELLTEFAKRFPSVAVDFQPGHALQSFDALNRRSIDVAVVPVPFAPFAPDVGYQTLGTITPIVAVPAGHRLASLDRISRSELLREPLLTWPRELNAPLVDYMRTVFFGKARHARLIEVSDAFEMVIRVAAGEGIAIVNPSVVALDISNIELRPFEDPNVVFEYGLTWLTTDASGDVARLLELARDMAERPSHVN